MNIIRDTTAEQLKALYDDSALSFEGMVDTEDNLGAILGWVRELTELKREEVHIVKGADMNRIYGLHGKNAYPPDTNIVCVMLSDMANPMKVAIPRFAVGGRWFDDIVDNNARCQREANED